MNTRVLSLACSGLATVLALGAACRTTEAISDFPVDPGSFAPGIATDGSDGLGQGIQPDAQDADVPETNDGGGCATASAEATRTPVYMQFVVDGSGSMDGFQPNGTFAANEREADPLAPTRPSVPVGLTGRKWIALRGALSAFFDDLAIKADPTMAVGLYLFSSNAVKSAAQVDVPVSFPVPAHVARLKARLLPPVFPLGTTPLAASISGQTLVLRQYTPSFPVASGGKYVLVVVTDGIPTDGRQATLNAISAARSGSPSISTFAVGVGNEAAAADTVYDEKFVASMAVAGGTAPAGCNTAWGETDKTGVPCHFQITPGEKAAAQLRDELLAAVNTIRTTVASCELTLNFAEGEVDPAKVNVEVVSGAGVTSQVVQDASNGWTYDDPAKPKKVVLHGASCDALKADSAAKVRIVLGCKTRTPADPK